MSWLARKLMISFAIIAIILIIIISIVLEFSLITVLIRVFAGSLIFSIIGGILGEVIYRNINSASSKPVAVKSNDGSEAGKTANESSSTKEENNMQSGERGEDIEPLEFEELNNEDNNVVNNIDGEQGAELVRQMSQDN